MSWPHLISGIYSENDVRVVCRREHILACVEHNQDINGSEEEYVAQLFGTLDSDHGGQRYTKVGIMDQLEILFRSSAIACICFFWLAG